MKMTKHCLLLALVGLWALGNLDNVVLGQAECTGWGNLTGVRVEGEFMRFGTSLRVVQPDWAGFAQTANERVQPRFIRDGAKQTISAVLANLSFTEAIEDVAPGVVTMDVQFASRADANMAGAFLCIELPAADYSGGSVQLIDPAPPAGAQVSLAARQVNGPNQYIRASAKGARFTSPRRQLEISFSEPTEIIVKDDRSQGNTDILVYLAVISGSAKANQTSQRVFTLKTTGEIDRNPITLTLDPSRPGRAFDGIGGNFRLQNATADPPIIQYNLENLRVTWARVEMPWSSWQPREDADPLEAAKTGQLGRGVQQAMEMARTLTQRKIPIILSAWSAPGWALMGGGARGGFGGGQPGGLRGAPLNPDKLDSICKSIGDYIAFLKQSYGVEVALFSFNESDLGINIRQTGQEHATLIKKLGAHLVGRGLITRMLLGDTSDATPKDFIRPAMADPEATRYIGAIAFHSWRGGTDDQLSYWGDAATKLDVPLLVAEASIDPAAHVYPAIFIEPAFVQAEIDLYIRICALCQPKSIMQWQLTSDYSILLGGPGRRGGAAQPLTPTQRFWNLKQLGSTPAGAFALPIASDRPAVTVAAFGDIANGVYAVHMVNNGTTRPVILTGLPANIKEMRVFVTDAKRNMQEGPRIPVTGSKAEFPLEKMTFTTLISTQ
jgi:hypothetical protein